MRNESDDSIYYEFSKSFHLSRVSLSKYVLVYVYG
jgi:hypothetical protein